jgi:hypothetical protein
MTMTDDAAPRLADDDLARVMELIKDSDSVEVKLTVPDADQASTVAALKMDPLDAEIRQVFFFDTPRLTLYQHGVVVRARRAQRKGDDSVVKLRPVVPSELPGRVRKLPEFVVEVDAIPGAFVCSSSMKGVPGVDVRKAVAGQKPLRKLFSKAQRAFYAEHAPKGVALDDLSVLGPIFVLKLRFAPKGYDRRLVAEMWLYPDYSRILELSTKCGPSEAFEIAAETRAFLAERGVDLAGEQETKTRTALEFFSDRLTAFRRPMKRTPLEKSTPAKAKQARTSS